MITEIDKDGFNRQITCSDWRYSATTVGMIRFMDERGIPYKIVIDEDLGQEALFYRMEDVIGKEAEAKYLEFVERYFKESMHHLLLAALLKKEELTAEEVKLVQEKMAANSILKKVFGKEKYSLENREKLHKLLADHRQDVIRETYRNGMGTYRNFANTGYLGTEKGDICRLNGYYVDLGKKGKSAAFHWNFNTYTANDEAEFDYIPFAFTRTRESFFINNNYSIKQLVQANDHLNTLLEEQENPRTCLLGQISGSSSFIKFNVEVIVKQRNEDFFHSLFLSAKSIRIFEQLHSIYPAITKPCRAEGDFLPLEQIVTDSIVNGIHLDTLIDKLLRSGESYHTYVLSHVIKINQLLYGNGGESMDPKMKGAYKAAKQVVEVFKRNKQENKINSYRQKLISAITFHDYERYNEILLQLSAYSAVSFNFAYDLFEDFEVNKNLAYTFVNALNDIKVNEGGNNNA